jgi:hypothetical protein
MSRWLASSGMWHLGEGGSDGVYLSVPWTMLAA